MQTLNLYEQEFDAQPIGLFAPEVLVADCLPFSAASMREALNRYVVYRDPAVDPLSVDRLLRQVSFQRY